MRERLRERLSRIELMPKSTLADRQWLFDAIRSRTMTQIDLHQAFNRRLEKHGVAAISKSSLNRYVQRVRDGETGRPKALGAPATEQGAVFATEFRARLTAAAGEDVTRYFEATLTSLAAMDQKENGQ